MAKVMFEPLVPGKVSDRDVFCEAARAAGPEHQNLGKCPRHMLLLYQSSSKGDPLLHTETLALCVRE